jgi:hypothetical protein
MAIGIGVGSFIATNNISGCMAGPPQRQHWQKLKCWSGLPEEPVVHEFWSHSNDYLA